MRIDRDTAHARRAQKDSVGEVAERAGAVTGALRRDPEARGACSPHGLGDVGRGLREHDGRRALVDGEVPRGARLVPAVVARPHELAVETRGQFVERGSLSLLKQSGCHQSSSLVSTTMLVRRGPASH